MDMSVSKKLKTIYNKFKYDSQNFCNKKIHYIPNSSALQWSGAIFSSLGKLLRSE